MILLDSNPIPFHEAFGAWFDWSIQRKILPVVQTIEVVVALVTTHGISPMKTKFLSFPASQPAHVNVTDVPPGPVIGVMAEICGVKASSYVYEHWSLLQEEMKPLISTFSWNC